MDKQSEQAREILTQKRQQRDRRQDTMQERAEAELHQVTQATTEDKARAAAVDQRLDQENSEAAMLKRSAAELKRE